MNVCIFTLLICFDDCWPTQSHPRVIWDGLYFLPTNRVPMGTTGGPRHPTTWYNTWYGNTCLQHVPTTWLSAASPWWRGRGGVGPPTPPPRTTPRSPDTSWCSDTRRFEMPCQKTQFPVGCVFVVPVGLLTKFIRTALSRLFRWSLEYLNLMFWLLDH